MTLAAAATSRVALATCVTNLVTRHPSITASAAASVDAAAGGRTILGVGAGHSGVANVGGAPSRAADLREGLTFLKAALSGAPASWRGASDASAVDQAPRARLRGGLGAGGAARGRRGGRRRLRQLRPRRSAREPGPGADRRGRGRGAAAGERDRRLVHRLPRRGRAARGRPREARQYPGLRRGVHPRAGPRRPRRAARSGAGGPRAPGHLHHAPARHGSGAHAAPRPLRLPPRAASPSRGRPTTASPRCAPPRRPG